MSLAKPKIVSHRRLINQGRPVESVRNIIKVTTIVVMLIATITVVVVAT